MQSHHLNRLPLAQVCDIPGVMEVTAQAVKAHKAADKEKAKSEKAAKKAKKAAKKAAAAAAAGGGSSSKGAGGSGKGGKGAGESGSPSGSSSGDEEEGGVRAESAAKSGTTAAATTSTTKGGADADVADPAAVALEAKGGAGGDGTGMEKDAEVARSLEAAEAGSSDPAKGAVTLLRRRPKCDSYDVNDTALDPLVLAREALVDQGLSAQVSCTCLVS